ncbi:MAG: acetyl-CoA carboxylase carboxyltransferase subunit alpha [Oscillospiraceae bacterium]
MSDSEKNAIVPTITASDKLNLVHLKGRPTINDFIPVLFDEFCEMHGDRCFGDDNAIIGGIANFRGISITVIAQVKGRNIEENKKSNFAMPHPEGYRKALRLAKQAEKFHRPIVCFIDTPGAFCGVAAEERGVGEAIAKNLFEFSHLKTPIISIVLGEGGSGGALGLGVCDELAMLENALYSVISPRGCANILWKDASREKEAADRLKITAQDMQVFGICESIISEPVGGSQNNPQLTAENISDYLIEAINRITKIDIETLLTNRYEKFRKIGEFEE